MALGMRDILVLILFCFIALVTLTVKHELFRSFILDIVRENCCYLQSVLGEKLFYGY